MSVLWSRVLLLFGPRRVLASSTRTLDAHDQERLDLYNIVARTLSMVDNVRGAGFQARYLRLALRSGDTKHQGIALALEGAYQANPGAKRRRKALSLVST